MVMNKHAIYQVSVKALIMDGDKLLVLHTPDGYIDFPGGRVSDGEQDLPWPDILQREISEELGLAFRTSVNRFAFATRRFYTHRGASHYVAVLYYRCDYTSGGIVLSDEHSRYEWLTPAELFALNSPFISDDEATQLRSFFGVEQTY